MGTFFYYFFNFVVFLLFSLDKKEKIMVKRQDWTEYIEHLYHTWVHKLLMYNPDVVATIAEEKKTIKAPTIHVVMECENNEFCITLFTLERIKGLCSESNLEAVTRLLATCTGDNDFLLLTCIGESFSPRAERYKLDEASRTVTPF